MNFQEGVHNERSGEKMFALCSDEQNGHTDAQTDAGEIIKKELNDLEVWRNNLLQKCEADECAGKNCVALRQVIEDEYIEKKFELHQRVYYKKHSV